MKRSLLYFFIIVFTWGVLPSAQAQMKAVLDSNDIFIGEQVTLAVSNTRDYPTPDQLGQNGIITIGQWFDTASNTQYSRLTCFEEGEHWLMVTPTDSLLITVHDVADVDTTSIDIKDIASVMREPFTMRELLPYAAIAWGIAIVAILLWYILPRIRRHEKIIPTAPKPIIPADQEALSRLEDLRTQQLWQQGKVKEYHTELTDIVRNYLERTFNIPSTEMTTDQTLEAFESTSARTSDDEQLLRHMLQTADMVKFAKSEPLPYEHDRSMSDAVEFVKHTDAIIKAQQAAEQQKKEADDE